MVNSKHFKESEFNRCSPSCSLQDMQQATIDKLDKARDIAGIPFVLTSAYRSPQHDKSKGRSGTGAHTLGHAIDIRCNDSASRYKIVLALQQAGFTRIGVANSFVHADDSPKHAQDILWTY